MDDCCRSIIYPVQDNLINKLSGGVAELEELPISYKITPVRKSLKDLGNASDAELCGCSISFLVLKSAKPAVKLQDFWLTEVLIVAETPGRPALMLESNVVWIGFRGR